MIKTNQNLGVSGEFQVIVRRADGSVKFDSGMQSNLILDNGIKHYLGLGGINSLDRAHTFEDGMMNECVVGTGNAAPVVGDTKLQHYVAKQKAIKDRYRNRVEPADDRHQGFVRLWEERKYIFDNINNQNISEVGLCTWHGDLYVDSVRHENVYVLVTRALIKDKGGSPITVTVLQGEILEVVYRLNMYININRQSGSFTLTTTKDNQDVTDTFDYFLQPYSIGGGDYISNSIYFPLTHAYFYTHGVKETDEELTADYDLADEVYRSITHLDTTPLNTKVVGNKSSGSWGSNNKYQDGHATWEQIEQSFETGRRTIKITHGIYSHIHDNGIRAFTFPIGDNSVTAFIGRGLVVVKNRANGQGIKKTNRQLWEVEVGYTISRWED